MTKSITECDELRETFDMLAERIDAILPESGREAFDAWRIVTTFILACESGIHPSPIAQANTCMAELAAILMAAGITFIP